MQATAGDLPQFLIGQISANFVLKRPARARHERGGVQHGVLFEKGMDGVGMPIGMEEQVTEVLLLIAPILAIGLDASLTLRLQMCKFVCRWQGRRPKYSQKACFRPPLASGLRANGLPISRAADVGREHALATSGFQKCTDLGVAPRRRLERTVGPLIVINAALSQR